MRRIFKWSVETNSLSLLADFPWKPSNLAFDSEDNLLVLFRYDAQPGYLINGKPEEMPVMPDTKGTSFSGYGNSAYTMRVYSIEPGKSGRDHQTVAACSDGSSEERV